MYIGLNNLGLNSASQGFNVQSLFAKGEPGAAFYLDGALTASGDNVFLYQDAAGTTPVTAVEQPVGLYLDRKYGLRRNAEQAAATYVTGSGSDNGTTVISATEFTTTAGTTLPRVAINLTGVGGCFEVTFRFTANSTGATGNVLLRTGANGQGSTIASTSALAVGTTYTFRFGPSPVGAQSLLWVGGGAASTFSVDSISIKEIPGNHRVQSTAGSRPKLRGVYNMLSSTEDFSIGWSKSGTGTASIPVVTNNAGTDPVGGNTAIRIQMALNGGLTATDFAQVTCVTLTNPIITGATYRAKSWVKANSAGDIGKVIGMRQAAGAALTLVTLTGAWQQVDYTEVGNSIITVMTIAALRGSASTADSVDMLIWHPDVRVAEDWTKGFPDYQMVGVSGNSYDTAGFPLYLQTDGVDDFMSGPMNLSTTDKATVISSITKLSDAAACIVYEHTTTSNNPGALGLFAPAVSVGATYGGRSTGTLPSTVASAGLYTAPSTNVVTLQTDVAGDSVVIRVNGGVSGTSVTDQGTGNYVNDTSYYAARAGTASFLSGREYALIIRGATTDTATLLQTERWAGTKAGVAF